MTRHILITGMYRSGTTLLHHLLDGHEQLKVFPVENCIFRDTLVHDQLPAPGQRSIVPLLEMIERGEITQAVDYIVAHDKLALALDRKIELTGSTGEQKIENSFDMQRFRDEMGQRIGGLPTGNRQKLIAGLFEAYLLAYYEAMGELVDDEDNIVLANKCPEAGLLIGHYLQHMPDAKIIHVVRDPRAVIASFKAKTPKHLYHPFFRILPQLKLLKNSLSVSSRYKNEPRVMTVSYEDMVTAPEAVMKRVAEFIEVPFAPILVEPTILGQPWKSNTSNVDNKDDRYGIQVNLDKYKNKLNGHEISLVEAICGAKMLEQGYELDTPSQRLNKRSSKAKYIIRSLTSIGTYGFKLHQRLSYKK